MIPLWYISTIQENQRINFPGASTQTPQGCLPPASQERGIRPNLATLGASLYAPRGGECTHSHSRNTGIYGKLTAVAADKMLKKYAKKAHTECTDVPLELHAHQLRHAKASHWLEDGMNIVQISFLLGHEHIQTTMVYLDITTEDEAKALATLEGDNESKTEKKWKKPDGSLRGFCGLPERKS